jgi:hypothetical protein
LIRAFTTITPITGHVVVDPPLSLGYAEKPRCHVDNLRLRVRREGQFDYLAVYPAQMQSLKWDFIIDDDWRLAKLGFYIGEIMCCERVLKRVRFRLTENPVGEVNTVNLVRDMCDDGLEPSCATAAPVCCPPSPPPCNYGPQDCCPTPALPTQTLPAPVCQQNPIPCPC